MKKSTAIFLLVLIFVCATTCLAFHAYDAVLNWRVYFVESTREGQPLVSFLDHYFFAGIKSTALSALMQVVDIASVILFAKTVKRPDQSRRTQ